MNMAAGRFKEWCDLNRLTLNLKKTKIMFFSNKDRKIGQIAKKSILIKMADQRIEITSEYKYLGLVLDDKLKFLSHIKLIKQRINYRRYLLKKKGWIITFKDALTIYKAMIMPILDIVFFFFFFLDIRYWRYLLSISQ